MREGFFQGGPVFGLGHVKASQLIVTFEIAAFHGDRKFFTGGDSFGVVLECGAGQNSLGLVADVQVHKFGVGGHDGALELAGATLCAMGMVVLKLREQLAERFGGGFCGWFNGRRRIWCDLVGHDGYRTILSRATRRAAKFQAQSCAPLENASLCERHAIGSPGL